MMQYAQAFNQLCQYGGYHVDTDAKKHDRFRRGLNTKLKECLNLVRVDSYNELVNMAITQEDCIMAHKAEKKRKAPVGPCSAPPQRYRLVQNATPQSSQKAPQQGRWIARPPQQESNARPPTPQQNGPRPNTRQPFCLGNANRCFNCGSSTHFAQECPQARQPNHGQGSNQNKNRKQTIHVR